METLAQTLARHKASVVVVGGHEEGVHHSAATPPNPAGGRSSGYCGFDPEVRANDGE